MNEIKKTALVGAGIIGNVHAKSMMLLGRPFNAICDIDAQKARTLASVTSPDAKIYTDFKQLINEFAPDVVHICTPHDTHADMIIYALDRNINVLCEKPLCISRSEIDAILEAERLSSAQLGICLQNRYLDSNLFVKNHIADKEIVSAHGSVVWNRTAEYYNSAAWRGTTAHEGGGVLINQAIHTLDLLGWFCGEPEYALASTDNLSLKDVIEVEDTVSAFFYGKHPFSFFATNAAVYNMPVQIDLKLSNEDHIILLPDTVIINGDVVFNATKQGFIGKSYFGIGHKLLISDFYNCISEGKLFAINGKEAAKVMRLVLAAYQSNREKIKIR